MGGDGVVRVSAGVRKNIHWGRVSGRDPKRTGSMSETGTPLPARGSPSSLRMPDAVTTMTSSCDGCPPSAHPSACSLPAWKFSKWKSENAHIDAVTSISETWHHGLQDAVMSRIQTVLKTNIIIRLGQTSMCILSSV